VFVNLSDLDHGLGAIIAAATILSVGAGLAYRWIVGPIKRMALEFKRNGGASLKDDIVRVQAALNEIQAVQALNAQALTGLARAMAFSEARVQILTGHQDCGYWESDPAGLCVGTSVGMSRLTGYDSAFWAGNNWASAVIESDRVRVIQEWRHAVSDQRRFEMEYAFQCADGSILPVQAIAYPVMAGGKCLGFVGEFCRDGGARPGRERR
jgi:PAS domain S-box-containing protein